MASHSNAVYALFCASMHACIHFNAFRDICLKVVLVSAHVFIS